MLEPSDMPEKFSFHWNNRNANGIANLFSTDASFVNVVGLWWNSRDEIYKAHEYGLRVIFADSELRVIKIRTRFLNDGTAVVNARMLLQGQSSSGGAGKAGTRKNMFTFVMTRNGDSWLCVAAHNTDIVPGAETNVVSESGELKPADYRDKK